MDDERPEGSQPSEPSGDLPLALIPEAQSKRRVGVAGIVALVLVIAAGAVATALVLFNRGEAPPLDELVPSGVVVYGQITLDPSLEQKGALRALAGKFPGGVSDFQGRVDRLLEQAFAEGGLRYQRDIKPWLGDQVAFAVMPPPEATGQAEPGEPAVVTLIAVEDEDAARRALRTAMSTGEGTFEVIENVAYLAEKPDHIRDLRSAVEKGAPLAGSAEYRKRAGSFRDGLAHLWLDGTELAELLRAVSPVPLASGSNLSGYTAVGLRAQADGLVVTGRQQIPSSFREPATGKPALLESTSAAGLLGSFTVFDLATNVENALPILEAATGGLLGGGPGGGLRELAEEGLASIGLSLDRDVLPWLHGEMSFVVGGITTPPVPDMALLVESTDDAAAGRTVDALRRVLVEAGDDLGLDVSRDRNGFTARTGLGFEVVVRRSRGRVVIASGERYARTVLETPAAALADDVVYRRVMGPPEDIVASMYVRLDRVRDLAEAFLRFGIPAEDRATYDRDVAPFLEPLEALAIENTIEGDESVFRMLVSVTGAR